MSTTSPQNTDEGARPDTTSPVFSTVVCGLDGSRPSQVALGQALTIAAKLSVPLRLVAVFPVDGPDPEEFLENAARLARERGVPVSSHAHALGFAASCLSASAHQRHELLVVGSRGNSRMGGVLLGSAATYLAHLHPGALLIAREPAAGAPRFPDRIVLAHDGRSHHPVRLTAAVAAAFDATVDIVHAGSEGEAASRALATASVAVRDVTGHDPNVEVEAGPPHRVVVDLASRLQASLIVCGRSGRNGLAALGSQSERIVHEATCSVLLPPALYRLGG